MASQRSQELTAEQQQILLRFLRKPNVTVIGKPNLEAVRLDADKGIQESTEAGQDWRFLANRDRLRSCAAQAGL